MKQEHFQSDQQILTDDLSLAQSSKEEAIRERLTDIFSEGVLEDSQFSPLDADEQIAINIVPGSSNSAGNPTITVRSGVAFSPIGERIVISSLLNYENPVVTVSTVVSGNSTLPDGTLNGPITKTDNGISGFTLTPRSSGSVNIPLIQNQTNRIWLGYLQTIDPDIFTLSKTTNERLFVKSTDGFEIRVTTSNINPDSNRFILIAEVIITNIVNTNDISFINRQYSYSQIKRVGIQLNTAIKPLNYEETSANLTGTISSASFTIDTLTFIISVNGSSDQTVTFSGIDPISVSDIISQINTNIIGITALNVNNSIKIVASKSLIVRNGTSNTVLGFTNGQSSLGKIISLNEHINSIGSGLISSSNPHATSAADLGIVNLEDIGRKLSSSGLIVPDASVNTSALFGTATSSGTAADNVVIFKPLLATEALNVGGVIITSSNIGIDTEFRFVDSLGAPIADGIYTFYVDRDLRTVVRSAAGEVINDPENKFVLAKITWTSPSLVLPIQDFRYFGTTANKNLRFETLAGLSLGLAVGNRTESLYSARLIGSIAGNTFNTSGTSMTVKVNGGTNQTVNFFGINPVSIDNVISQINTQISGIVAVRTIDLKVKLIAITSLEIISGSALALLGFSPAQQDSGDLKEIQISGDFSTIAGTNSFISINYGESNHPSGPTDSTLITSVSSFINGVTLKTDINYLSPTDPGSNVLSIVESVI